MLGKNGAKEKINTYLWLNDLEIPYLNATGRKVGDLKLDLNRSLAFATTRDASHASAKTTHHATTLVVVATNRWQTKLSAHQELFAAAELFDFPDDG